MDIVGSPIFSKPGRARLAYNYEYSVKGGLERIGGIEPFSGRPAPSAAIYVYLQCSAAITGINLGDTVDGATSGASGVAIYISGAFIAMTRVTGSFALEDLEVSAVVKATTANLAPAIDGFLDNTLAKLAADNYQADITRGPGVGAVRGLAALNDVVYAWRNNAGNTAMDIYKSSSAGWVLVPLNHQLSFNTGSTAAPAEGATLTQGGTTAVVLRVVLESGTFAANTAAGRLIIGSISGGVFAAGAATYTGGTINATAAESAIALAINGRVRTDAYTFTAALESKRLYGCDGVNPEFEFDGTVYAPISTGMGSIRATSVKCHKSYLYLAYRGSLQRSAIGDPYVWSAVFGAAELGTGDEITNLVSVGGNTSAAALMVLCRNAMFVLYEDSAGARMDPLSRVSGALPDSAQDIGGVVALDTPGVMRYPYTKDFGNFAWDTVSMDIQPIAAKKGCSCSVFVSGLFKYRLFFSDGTAISGLPVGKSGFEWSVINYGRNILLAEHAEIDGVARTFYADDDGWVYEADKGRSLAGDPLPYAVKLLPLTQRSPMVEKTYRSMQLEIEAEGACTLYTSAEFGNAEDGATQQTATPQYGAGLTWDLTNYDQAYWDTAAVGLKTMPLEGSGTRVAISVAGESDKELPHTLSAVTVLYTPRRMTR
jgi:hypothetical protein